MVSVRSELSVATVMMIVLDVVEADPAVDVAVAVEADVTEMAAGIAIATNAASPSVVLDGLSH